MVQIKTYSDEQGTIGDVQRRGRHAEGRRETHWLALRGKAGFRQKTVVL
jgi:hypothetical protein